MKHKYNSTFSSRIEERLAKQVKDFCFKKNIKVQEFLEEALIDKLNKDGRYEKPHRLD